MSGPSEDEKELVLKTLTNLSLSESRNIKRDFCLTPPPAPSPTLSELNAADEAARDEADELEWLIESLPERMASEHNHTAKPPMPDEDEPYYEEMLQCAQVYQQWWELPGIDMNEGNNRTRFRSAYHRVAFNPRPFAWEGMTEWEMIWSMYDWEERLRKNAEDLRKLAEYSIRGQAKLKQVPEDIDEGFDFIFESEGRITKVHIKSDFCQGKLRAYDGVGREVDEQKRLVRKFDHFKRWRKYQQDNNKYVYRETKRFHDGTPKLAHWMVLQEANEKLGDADAYKANAITHLRLARIKTPNFNPDPPTSPTSTTPAAIPNRKYATLRKPSPRVIPLGTQSALWELFQGREISEKIGAPGRPNARVRRLVGDYIKKTIIHGDGSKRARRQLHYARIRKTKTDWLLEAQPLHDPVSEMNKLHWVLDDEGNFRDYRYIESDEDFELSEWREMPPVGITATKSIDQGRRFSMD